MVKYYVALYNKQFLKQKKRGSEKVSVFEKRNSSGSVLMLWDRQNNRLKVIPRDMQIYMDVSYMAEIYTCR